MKFIKNFFGEFKNLNGPGAKNLAKSTVYVTISSAILAVALFAISTGVSVLLVNLLP